MIVWRLTKEKYTSTTYSGAGSLLVGGRWLPKGHPVVYTSDSPVLAVLENVVHADPSTLVDPFVFVPAELPEDLVLETVEVDDLSRNWRMTDQCPECQTIGLDWHARQDAVGLIVPSAVVPLGKSLLLNPGHPDVARIQPGDPIPYRFDERLI